MFCDEETNSATGIARGQLVRELLVATLRRVGTGDEHFCLRGQLSSWLEISVQLSATDADEAEFALYLEASPEEKRRRVAAHNAELHDLIASEMAFGQASPSYFREFDAVETEIESQRLLVARLKKFELAESNESSGVFGPQNGNHYYFAGMLSDGLYVIVIPVPAIECDSDFRVYVVPSKGTSSAELARSLHSWDCWSQVVRGLRPHPSSLSGGD